MLIIKYEFINHGIQHADYFQGCGTSLTGFDECFTGIGDTPAAAANEALDLASHEYKWNDAVFDDAEIEAATFSSVESIPEDSDAMFHVSIRIKYIT